MCCKNSSEEEDETTTFEDGNTRTVTRITRTGGTVSTTTTTTYISEQTSSSTSGIRLIPASESNALMSQQRRVQPKQSKQGQSKQALSKQIQRKQVQPKQIQRKQVQIKQGQRQQVQPRPAQQPIPEQPNASGSRSSSAPPERNPKFEQECLNEHNRLRALHGCPPLAMDERLTSLARNWARTIARTSVMQHSSQQKYGENLYMCFGKIVDGKEPVKAWYSEIKDYNYDAPGFSPETGHFTQVLWKTTRFMGVAVEKKGNEVFVVANYEPPGNFLDRFGENVPRLLTEFQ